MTVTALVTGATGTVGRPLTEELVHRGHEVRGLTRRPEAANLPDGVTAVGGDLTDLDSLERALDGVTHLHLITFTGDGEPLERPEEIVALATATGVEHVTVLMGGYPGPVEAAVRTSGLRWTEIAPVEFMSNTLEWAPSVRGEGVVREGFPELRSTVVHERDIAAVAAATLVDPVRGEQTLTVTGPEPLSQQERVTIIGEVLDRPVTFEPLTLDEVLRGWRVAGFTDEDVDFFLAMRQDPPDASLTVLDTVREVAGAEPHTFRDWVREHRAAFA